VVNPKKSLETAALKQAAEKLPRKPALKGRGFQPRRTPHQANSGFSRQGSIFAL
jgi:hypothetical protein